MLTVCELSVHIFHSTS